MRHAWKCALAAAALAGSNVARVQTAEPINPRTTAAQVRQVQIPKEIEQELLAQLRREAGRPVKAPSRNVAGQFADATRSAEIVGEQTPAAVSQGALVRSQSAVSSAATVPAASARSQPDQRFTTAAGSLANTQRLMVDCTSQAPQLRKVGTLRPGQPFSVEGSCLGSQHGTIEVIGLPAGKIVVPFTQWSETRIAATMPTVSGVADRPLPLTVIRNPDKKSSRPREVSFRAQRELVRVPAERWSPSHRYQYSQTADEVGQIKFNGTYSARVQVNPACHLDGVGARPGPGSVRAIRGWENGPPHRGDILVDWSPGCVSRNTVRTHVISTTEHFSYCAIDLSLDATAWCPVGIQP